MATKTRKLTKDEIIRVGKYAGLGLTNKHIASLLETSLATFERRLADQKGVREGLEKGKAEAAGAITQTLFKQAMKGNVPCMLFWLKTRLNWRETSILDDENLKASWKLSYKVKDDKE